jgi:hypothetical protein
MEAAAGAAVGAARLNVMEFVEEGGKHFLHSVNVRCREG